MGKVVVLKGKSGISFFLYQTLLDSQLVQQVELVDKAYQATHLLHQAQAYALVIINLAENWEQGIQLGQWIETQKIDCPVILITDEETEVSKLIDTTKFTLLAPTLSLDDFITKIQELLYSSEAEFELK